MSRLEKQSVGWVAIAVALAFPLSLCVHFGTGVFPESTRSARLGTATSGNAFLGERIRRFPGNRVRFSKVRISGKFTEKMFEKPTWAHLRSCQKWSVTTTIFNASDAVRIQTQLPEDWCMVVVGDEKGPQHYQINEGKNGRVIYLNTNDQKELERAGVKLSNLLPWNSFGRKNLGYLYAIASGAQLIWDFDDDNALLSSPPRILEPKEVHTVLVVKQRPNNTDAFCASFNPMPLMGASLLPSWPRGLPLSDIKNQACQTEEYIADAVKSDSKNIGVFQSLANHDPDVDAIYRLTKPLPLIFDPPYEDQTVLVPAGAYAPFNAQATLFTYEAFFMLILPVTVHGRVSDIWRSYFGQRLLKDIGYQVAFTYPQVLQNRNSHNYLADLDSEQPLYMKSGRLIEHLRGWSSPCQSLDCHFEALIIDLYEHDFVEIGDVELVQEWIECLHQIGYQYPDISVGAMYSETTTVKGKIVRESEAFKEKQEWSDLQPNQSEMPIPIITPNMEEQTEILVMVMGPADTFFKWYATLKEITAHFVFFYASYDKPLCKVTDKQQCQCHSVSSSGVTKNNSTSETTFHCEVFDVRGTTWTEGRNQLASKAIIFEEERKKRFAYWLFADDDIEPFCDRIPTKGTRKVYRTNSPTSCWQNIFDYMASSMVPEKASAIALAQDGSVGFQASSSADAMFFGFKRDYVPFYLPYPRLRLGASEWLSQAGLFCVTYMYD